jgi:hypothetical protein
VLPTGWFKVPIEINIIDAGTVRPLAADNGYYAPATSWERQCGSAGIVVRVHNREGAAKPMRPRVADVGADATFPLLRSPRRL